MLNVVLKKEVYHVVVAFSTMTFDNIIQFLIIYSNISLITLHSESSNCFNILYLLSKNFTLT